MADALDALIAKYSDQSSPLDALVAKYSSPDVQPATHEYPSSGGLTIAPKGGKPSDQPPVGVGEDVARSFATGVENLAIDLAGLPGDMQSFIRRKFNIPEHVPLPSIYMPGVAIQMPTSGQLRSGVEGVLGPSHQPQTMAGKYAETAGEFTAGAIGGEGGLARRAAQVVLPAAVSETTGQLTEGTSAEPYARVAGALIGAAAPSAVARAITPFPVSGMRQKALDVLKAEGVTPTAGQASGSRMLKYAESELGGGATDAALERQREQFTRAALRRAGIDSATADAETIDNAFTRIGGEFDRLAANNAIVPGTYGQLLRDIQGVANQYADVVPDSLQARIIGNTVNDIAGKIASGQPISGAQYQAFRSRFDKLARAARNDPQLSEALFGIRNALDDAMERSIAMAGNPADAAAWRQARQQYRNLLVLEKAVAAPGENAATGAISPAKLRQADVGQNRRRFVRGKSDFAALARAGEAIMSPLPQSGTAPRAAVRTVPAVIGGALGAMFGGGSPGAVLGTLAGAAAPAVAGRILLSRPMQAYLRNQLVPGGNIKNALLRQSIPVVNVLAPPLINSPQ